MKNLSKKGELFVFFALVFLVFFSSAAGLYNSMDAPQYFTSRALIENRNLDLSVFADEAHAYTVPDVYFRNGETLGMRGYLLSLISIPIHKIGSLISSLLSIKGFPIEAVKADDFRDELAITSLFALYSILGLVFFWETIKELTGSGVVTFFVSVGLALGTYVWKYSSSYIRQGAIVGLLGVTTYSIFKYYSEGKRRKGWIFLFLLCWALSFGIDVVLFISLSVYLCFLVGYLFVFKKKELKILTGTRVNFLIFGILLINVVMNYRWYGTFWFSQTNLQPLVREAVGVEVNKVWTSTPLLPTVPTVLFNFGKINQQCFRNFDGLPKEIGIFTSLDYAKKYNFFGLFAVSPFLLFFIFSPKKLVKKYIGMMVFCVIIFCLGILGNSKVLNFWGGNQYDIRYFYPYALLLGPFTALGLNRILEWKGKLRIVLLFCFVALFLFSILMGWLGVMGMFKPALSGERKIWVDILNFSQILKLYNGQEIFNATFMNRKNYWIPITVSFFLWLLMVMMKKLKYFFEN